MKTKLLTLLAIVSIALFSSCSKDDEGSSLNGTKWVSSYSDGYFVLEFGSSSVTGYFADENYIIDGNVSTASYSMSGDNVYMTDLAIRKSLYDYRFVDVTVSGSIMSTSMEYKLYSSSEWKSLTSHKFQKL